MTGFGQPSGGGNWIKPAEINGHLILITKVHAIEKHFDNLKDAEVDRAEFDMVDLNGDRELQVSMYNSHPGIVNKLKSAMRQGNGVLGRIGQAPTQKGNPAWVLGPYVEGTDDVLAQKWLDAQSQPQFKQPQAQAPAAAPVTQAAPAAAPVQATAPAPAAVPANFTGKLGDQHYVNSHPVDAAQYERLKGMGILTETVPA